MLDDLRPQSLPEAALGLGIDPFELVRLAVGAGVSLERLGFAPEDSAKIAAFAGIDSAWWEGASLPADDRPRRARVRALLARMVERKLVGDSSTRLDNLWRGLDPNDRALVEQAVRGMLQEGVLRTFIAPRGHQVSIAPQALGAVQQFVGNGAGFATLQGLW
jgi:hypothetical protein